MVNLEIALDFTDEVEQAEEIGAQVRLRLNLIERRLAGVEASYANAERVRDGLTLLIAGAPNAENPVY